MTADKKQTARIIEGNEDNMVLITMLLHKSGYETIWAETGIKGVQLTLEQKPGFVLLDIQLPDIDGTEVLKRIWALDDDIAVVPIIAMTSYAMAGDREKLLAAGYIEKPINPMRAMAQIQSIVSIPKWRSLLLKTLKAGEAELGLYLTKKITEDLLYGNVYVESRPDCGSVFGIRIPIDI